MMDGRVFAALVVTAAVGLLACDDDSQEPPPEDLPAAQGSALWSYLQDQNYATNWSLWPGKGERYQGTEPHGMLLTTYVNEIALAALQDGATSLPEGAIVVKENYMPDGTLDAVTTMYKVRAFDPAHNDWFWLKNDPAGVIDVEGSVTDCWTCHAGADDFDYLWTLQQEAVSSQADERR